MVCLNLTSIVEGGAIASGTVTSTFVLGGSSQKSFTVQAANCFPDKIDPKNNQVGNYVAIVFQNCCFNNNSSFSKIDGF